MAEAKRLWELEQSGQSRLTTIQAAIHLHIVTQLNGVNKVSKCFSSGTCQQSTDFSFKMMHPNAEPMVQVSERHHRVLLSSDCETGLVEGIVNEPCEFTVETPGRGQLEVKVEGPKSDAKVNITNNNGRYKVSYHPTGLFSLILLVVT